MSRAESRSTLFSALGELLWYLSASNSGDFIDYYIPGYKRKYAEVDGRIHGGYGPRLFDDNGVNQISAIIDRLKNKRDTRRAVIQLFRSTDISSEYRDIPCTCTLQFLVRRNILHLVVHMRSNDAFLGLPYDIFCFTMLQELVAKSIRAKLGTYNHFVGSLHLYDEHTEKAESYLTEGWQSTVPMPPMPDGDPWPAIEAILQVEQALRNSSEPPDLDLDPYWQDLIRLLGIIAAAKSNSLSAVRAISKKMHFDVYATYVERRSRRLKIKEMEQLDIHSIINGEGRLG